MVFSIDAGTTNTKVFLFTEEGRLTGMASQPTPTSYPQPGWVEQPAEGWWQAIRRAGKRLKPLPGKKVLSGVAISSQGGTFVLLDKSQKPLRPAITWLDNRAGDISAHLNREYGENFFYRKTGHVLKGWAPLSLLIWLKRHQPEIMRKTYRLSFVSDYLNFRLTGRFYLDPTSAQMSCLYNIKTGTWDEELLQLVGLQQEQLPEILPADTAGGETIPLGCHQCGLPASIPVVAGGHDQYCACLGAGAEKTGDILLSCGTAWALLLTTDSLIFDNTRRWVPGRHLLAKKYGLMGVVSEAGALLAWMRKNFRIDPVITPQEIAGITIGLGFSEGKGTISGLSLGATGTQIYFQALQTVVGEVCSLLKIVEKRTGVKRIHLVGGGTRELLLPLCLERITGKKVLVSRIREAAGWGAALLVTRKELLQEQRGNGEQLG